MDDSNWNSVFELGLCGLLLNFWTLFLLFTGLHFEGSWSGWSSMQLVAPAALVIEGSHTSSLMTPPLVSEGSMASGVVTDDSSLGVVGIINLSFSTCCYQWVHLHVIKARIWWWLLFTWGWKGYGDVVEHLHLGPSMQLAQGCLIVCDQQPWP